MPFGIVFQYSEQKLAFDPEEFPIITVLDFLYNSLLKFGIDWQLTGIAPSLTTSLSSLLQKSDKSTLKENGQLVTLSAYPQWLEACVSFNSEIRYSKGDMNLEFGHRYLSISNQNEISLYFFSSNSLYDSAISWHNV